MKVVIAIDSFKGSISSPDAGAAIREGIHRVFPDAEIFVRPLADGGEGTVEALALGMHGRIRTVTVTGPLGTPVEAVYGILDDSKTAIIEMSAAAGITLVDEPNRNPLYTTTYGVGTDPRRHRQRMPELHRWYRRKCHKRRRHRYASGSRI